MTFHGDSQEFGKAKFEGNVYTNKYLTRSISNDYNFSMIRKLN